MNVSFCYEFLTALLGHQPTWHQCISQLDINANRLRISKKKDGGNRYLYLLEFWLFCRNVYVWHTCRWMVVLMLKTKVSWLIISFCIQNIILRCALVLPRSYQSRCACTASQSARAGQEECWRRQHKRKPGHPPQVWKGGQVGLFLFNFQK